MQHPAARAVPSSHAKHPAVLPLAASATGGARAHPPSGVPIHRRLSCPRGRRICRALLAASDPTALGEFVCTDNTNQRLDAKLSVDKYFETEMTVQDCDLDVDGVVNNAIYATYIDKAREELLVRLGISTGWIISTGNAMALSELSLKYFTPLRRGDKFVVKVRVARIKGVRIFVEHLIERLPDRKLVLDATATIVCLNKDYRLTRVFPLVSARVHHFFSSKDS